MYEETRDNIIMRLVSAGQSRIARAIADSYTTVTSIITNLYQSNLLSIKEKNLHYIGLYGANYFNSLLDYLIQQSMCFKKVLVVY